MTSPLTKTKTTFIKKVAGSSQLSLTIIVRHINRRKGYFAALQPKTGKLKIYRPYAGTRQREVVIPRGKTLALIFL